MKTRTKNIKRTSAPRAARKPKVDPRLVRVYDVLEEIWDSLADSPNRGVEEIERAMLEVVQRHLSARGVFACMLAEAVKVGRKEDLDVALDELVAIAESEHRAHCSCCRERHEKTAVQS